MTTMTIDEARVEALFVSDLQRSQDLGDDAVRRAVDHTITRHGARGCAALVAQEFGEHPETAVSRMQWALSAIRTAYAA
ncbi:hypothetical protein GCM10010124_39370 [Pilimelia terevasa]|uniref:Uncharacterized protein n=1 Tax=Pilimelia terevasa TaxID=53372 RepID=A0A8J3BV45_9ACTN|nr:hypothetical protein [Pilimelia terevasa]GGK42666.1 hypothetical protein GCM10010124_39370 [Pilimelia terevasa]